VSASSVNSAANAGDLPLLLLARENVETKRRMHNLVVASGLIEKLIPLKPRMATEDELERCVFLKDMPAGKAHSTCHHTLINFSVSCSSCPASMSSQQLVG
jgi:hypothetical protein